MKKYQYTLNILQKKQNKKIGLWEFSTKIAIATIKPLWYRDSTAFQPLIGATIVTTLDGTSRAYAIAVEDRTAKLHRCSGTIVHYWQHNYELEDLFFGLWIESYNEL
jgi:hypothetical protein